MQRGPRACGSGQIMSLKENVEALLLPSPTLLTQKCVVVFLHYSHLDSCIDLVGETGEALICFIPCSVSVCNQRPLLLLLSYLRLKRKKTGRCSSPQATDSRNEENRGWELEWKGTRTHACIHTQKHSDTHMHAQAYTLTHMSQSMLQDHTASAVTCSVNMSEGVYWILITEDWVALGEKTNKPHRVTGRGGKGPREGFPSVIQVQ